MLIGDEGLRELGDMVEAIREIRAQAHLYITHGQSFSLRDDVRVQLAEDFWNYMHSFDFNNVSRVCADWKYEDNASFSQLLDKWYAFVSQETPAYTSADDLFEMVDEVCSLLQNLYNIGKSQYTQRIINVYNGLEDIEEQEL